LEREKNDYKSKLTDKEIIVKELIAEMNKIKIDFKEKEDRLENENTKLRNDFENRINEYEDTLNKKIEENKSLMLNNSNLTQKI